MVEEIEEGKDKESGLKLDKWQGLLIFVVVQSCSGVYWASWVSLSLGVLKEKTVEIAATVKAEANARYTAQDAARDFAFRDKEMAENKARLAEMDRRMIELERRFALKVQ